MPNERLILAIGQMERALARLESVHVGLAKELAAGMCAPDADLAQRHARLKAAASDALAQIDTLLAKTG